jgi:capsular exopolysaccharide synthesis family protein
VSKFFRALEHAERERAQERATAVETPERRAPAAGVAPPPAREDAAPPPVTPAPRVAEPTPRAVEPPPREVEPPVVERKPAYGAPVVREVTAAHEGAFSALLAPAPAVDPGEVDDHLVSVLEPTSLAAEQYRSVRLAIENFHRERGTRLVAVSSPGRGDGKTMTAINLAGALAQSPDARVVLVEVDLRHPSMAGALGLRGGHGLSSYLLDHSIGVEAAIERPRGLGFAVVVAGSVSSMPYELLTSPRLSALLAELRERFDFVVVDTPPALPFPDVGILRNLVDGFVLVVRANRTPREHVRESLDTIGTQRVLGVIFNDDDRTGAAARHEPGRRRLRDYLQRARGGDRAA